MCSLTIPTTQLTNDEVAYFLDYATRLARNLARRPDTDYEAAASDALVKAIRKMPGGGPRFRAYLNAAVFCCVRNQERHERRYRSRVAQAEEGDLDARPAREQGTNALDGLTPKDQALITDLFISKLTEAAAAAKNGTSRRQLRNNLERIRKELERALENV